MQISVIIPTFNEQSLLAGAVRSADAAGADQIIVADGFSTDETLTVANELNCEVIQTRAGRGHQLAEGCTLATGEVLVFLHADCRLGTECLKQILKKKPEQQWGCFQHRIDATGRRFRWLEKGNRWRAKSRGLVYGDQTLWVERQLYEAVGGFPRVPLMEDVAISDFLRKQAGPPCVLPGPTTLSARHWKKRGVVRTTIRNKSLLLLYRLGVSEERIAKMYRR